MSDLLPLATQLHALSGDPDNQPILARDDNILQALTTLLSHPPPVLPLCIAAIANLASHPDNYDVLRSETDLIDALKNCAPADGARDILEDLGESEEEEEEEEEEGAEIRLHVPGVSDDMFCVRVEQLLIRKNGVISIGFERSAEVAVVFCRLHPDALRQYVATMTGKKVSVVQEVEEVGYLDERGERLRDMAKKQKRTVTQGASSLHERLRAHRGGGRRQGRLGWLW